MQMRTKLLYSFTTAATLLFMGLYITSDDNGSVSNYINGGGLVNQSETPVTGKVQTDNPVWTAGANMPAPTRYHGSGVSFSRNDTNWLICLGGDENGTGSNSSVVSIYNATTNSWLFGAQCPPTLVFYASASRLGNIIYLI